MNYRKMQRTAQVPTVAEIKRRIIDLEEKHSRKIGQRDIATRLNVTESAISAGLTGKSKYIRIDIAAALEAMDIELSEQQTNTAA
jgi:transcriptional regulator with XRE-family HTH domain